MSLGDVDVMTLDEAPELINTDFMDTHTEKTLDMLKLHANIFCPREMDIG